MDSCCRWRLMHGRGRLAGAEATGCGSARSTSRARWSLISRAGTGRRRVGAPTRAPSCWRSGRPASAPGGLRRGHRVGCPARRGIVVVGRAGGGAGAGAPAAVTRRGPARASLPARGERLRRGAQRDHGPALLDGRRGRPRAADRLPGADGRAGAGAGRSARGADRLGGAAQPDRRPLQRHFARNAKAARLLGVAALRDIDEQGLEERASALSPSQLRRARHVVSDDRRTLEAAAALASGDLPRLGALFAESQRSMAEDLRISTPELDALVRIAGDTPGVVASRLTGSRVRRLHRQPRARRGGRVGRSADPGALSRRNRPKRAVVELHARRWCGSSSWPR